MQLCPLRSVRKWGGYIMPINKKMMESMKKQYGAKKGKDVYYTVEQKQKTSSKKKKKQK